MEEIGKVMTFGDYGVHDGLAGGADKGLDIGVHDGPGGRADDGLVDGVHDHLSDGNGDGTAARQDEGEGPFAPSNRSGLDWARGREDKNGKKRELSDEEGVDSTAPSKSGSAKKKREVTGVAKEPSKGMLKFNTTRYALYNPALKNVGEHVEHSHVKFDNYNSYTLFMIPDVRYFKEIPTEGVRLDDMHVAILIDSGKFSKKQLNENWRAEFDGNGMVRGMRVPLGHAAKKYKKAGDVDIDGNVLEEKDQGWYYLWHRGLHMLGGQESLDARVHKKRPSFERDLCNGTTFKKSFPAVLQYPPGHPDDTLFEDMPSFTKLTLKETDLTKPSSSKPPASTSGTKDTLKPSSSKTSTNNPRQARQKSMELDLDDPHL